MSERIVRRRGNTLNRNRKGVLLVVTSKLSLSKEAIDEIIDYSPEQISVRIIQSLKREPELTRSVKRYMKMNEISLRFGDRVYFYDERRWLN